MTAVDIEYYKGDMPRFINTLLHETFHATQSAIAAAHNVQQPAAGTPQQQALLDAASYMLREGTANYIAPTIERTPESAAMMVDSGVKLLRALSAFTASSAFNADSARRINDVGVSGGGPYYWLGGAMSKVIADAEGPKAIGQSFEQDQVEFVRRYVRDARKTREGPWLIPPEFLAQIEKRAAAK